MKDKSLALAVLAGTIGFFYQLSEVLTRHTAWTEFSKPAGMGELLFAMVCGLSAIAAALGLNVSNLLRGFQHKE